MATDILQLVWQGAMANAKGNRQRRQAMRDHPQTQDASRGTKRGQNEIKTGILTSNNDLHFDIVFCWEQCKSNKMKVKWKSKWKSKLQ